MTAKSNSLLDAPRRRRVSLVEDKKRRMRAMRVSAESANGHYEEVDCPCCGVGKVFVTRDGILGAWEMIELAADVLTQVAEEYGVTPGDLVGKRRFRRLIPPRYRCYWILRYDLGLPLTTIGQIMNRDHSTIMAGLKRMTQEGEYIPTADEMVGVAA